MTIRKEGTPYMDTFADSRDKVFDFIGAVQNARDAAKEDDAFKNSTNYKLKMVNANKDKMRDYCCNHICKKMYYDALPLGDTYKCAHHQDIDDAFAQFIASRCPQGLTFYIKEGLKKGNAFAKRLMESVEDMVRDAYYDRELHVEDYGLDQIEFDPKKDAEDDKLEIIADDLSAPEISQKLFDMTKQTAVDEIIRAKRAKAELTDLQNELSNDVNMNSRAAVESALEMRGVTNKKFYTPTLFAGINIGKLNMLRPKYESGELQDYDLQDALAPFKSSNENEGAVEEAGMTEAMADPKFASLEELAFVESVKEFTGLSLVKALRLETFNKRDVMNMADSYAQMR